MWRKCVRERGTRDQSTYIRRMSTPSHPWTHKSIKRFAGAADPVEAILSAARAMVLRAMDAGWKGPPFDPIALAEIMRIEVAPRDDVRDARVVPAGRDGVRIEFNPSRPPNRVRYSIAHEIAHTFFPDCAERVRHRAAPAEMKGDEWQLEALCNIAAAELLMPAGSLPPLTPDALEIRSLLSLRERYAVSTEALLIRVAKSAEQEACAAFCASHVTQGSGLGRIRLDYVIGSPRWNAPLRRGILLPTKTALRDCVAIGYTASATESWGESASLRVEGVAIPAYPGDTEPRVVGIIATRGSRADAQPMLRYVRGDATKPRGEGPGIVAHVVNDATANWGGGGFASAVRRALTSSPDSESHRRL